MAEMSRSASFPLAADDGEPWPRERLANVFPTMRVRVPCGKPRAMSRVAKLALLGAAGILFFALFVISSVACGGRQPGPVRVLNQYSQALDRGDYDHAYDLMSDQYRAQNSKTDFVRMLEENPREVKETAGRLRSAGGDLEVNAELKFGLGDRMRLVKEGGRWKISSNPVDFYSQASPREALRSFLRAYSLKRWDVMLRFVPTSYRERMTAETMREQFQGEHKDDISRMMAMIAANVDEPIADKGNEAQLRYGDFEVTFVREETRWKIKDLD